MQIENELKEILLGSAEMDDNYELYGFESPQGPYDDAMYGETDDLYPQEEGLWDTGGSILTESEATDLAQQLMNISTEAEMEEFLGNLFKKVKRGLKKVGRVALPIAANLLKKHGASLLKRALPLVGSAVGSVIPGAGTVVGGALGGALSQMIPGEMESYSSDYEAKLDLSKRLVQTVANAAVQAARDPNAGFDAGGAAKQALAQQVEANLTPAIRQKLAAGGGRRQRATSGQWVRKGNQIILIGV